MGFRFDFRDANLMANLLSGRFPDALKEQHSRSDLKRFVDGLVQSSVSSDARAGEELSRHLHTLSDSLHQQDIAQFKRVADKVTDWLDGPKWVGMLVADQPRRGQVSNYALDASFLRDVVEGSQNVDANYVLLQPTGYPEGHIAVESAFPAFEEGLRNRARWPGLVAWSSSAAVGGFFALPTSNRQRASEAASWLVANISTAHAKAPKVVKWTSLKKSYESAFPETSTAAVGLTRIVHLSDIHCGSKLSLSRTSRLCQLVSNVVDRDSGIKVIPVVTGDLLDSPLEHHVGHAELFLESLSHRCKRKPLVIPGNHDVKTLGIMKSDRRYTSLFETQRIVDFEKEKVRFVCLDSCQEPTDWAKGAVGVKQLTRLGTELDANKNPELLQIALLHHHLLPVATPDWYRTQLWERIVGKVLETKDLEDAATVIKWLDARKIRVAMHGHEHIPHATNHDKLCVLGCGSSVGKVKTKVTDETYMSLNVVTINWVTRRLYCELIAERVFGGGEKTEDTHEVSTSYDL